MTAFLDYFYLFNRKRYWEAHEILEDPWREADRDAFLQGLILVASSYVHILHRNNPPGAVKHLGRCLELLEPYPNEHKGVPVGQLISHCKEMLRRVEALPEGAYLAEHVPRINLEPGRPLVQLHWDAEPALTVGWTLQNEVPPSPFREERGRDLKG